MVTGTGKTPHVISPLKLIVKPRWSPAGTHTYKIPFKGSSELLTEHGSGMDPSSSSCVISFCYHPHSSTVFHLLSLDHSSTVNPMFLPLPTNSKLHLSFTFTLSFWAFIALLWFPGHMNSLVCTSSDFVSSLFLFALLFFSDITRDPVLMGKFLFYRVFSFLNYFRNFKCSLDTQSSGLRIFEMPVYSWPLNSANETELSLLTWWGGHY